VIKIFQLYSLRALVSKLLLLLVGFYTLASYGQVVENNFSFGLGAGIDLVSFKDVSSSPLVYSGFGLPLSFNAKYNTTKTLHQLDFSIISPSITNNYPLKSKANTALISWNKTNLNYQFLLKINQSSNYVGAAVKAQYFYRTYNFLDGDSWDFIGSAGIHYLKQITITDKYTFAPSITLPLLAFIHRKPSLTLDEEFLDDFYNRDGILKYGKWKPVLNDWFKIEINISNEFKISKRITLLANAGAGYYFINFPEKLTTINYQIGCTASYQF